MISLLPPARSAPEHNRKGPDSEQPFSYDRKFDLTQQKVIFNPIGQFATDVSFAHIELVVPYDVFDTTLKQLYEDFQRTKEIGEAFMRDGISNSDPWVRQRMSKMSDIIREGLAVLQLQANTTMIRLIETLFKLPERTRSDLDQETRLRRSLPSSATTAEEHDHDPHGSQRNRRFIEAVIGIGASIIGAIWDIYKMQDIRNIKEGLRQIQQRVNQQQDTIKKLLHVQLDHSKILQQHAENQAKVSRQLNKELNTDAYGTLMKLRTLLTLIEDQARIFGDTV